MVREFVIDLFCGAGGTSEGVFLSNTGAKVTACVNHDLNAIKSHAHNHPQTKHFIEDVRNPEVVWFLKLRVNALRKLWPDCIITIWASLECTNFSKAKGGLPRDADSRTLAEHLFMYLDAIDPDYLMIENVVEFMAWGPLNEKGKPISLKKGQDYLQWIQAVKLYGYKFSWRELNAADYGAYTSRNRYFAQFAKHELPIVWPEPTHAKNPEKVKNLFGKPLKKWRSVKDVLKLDIEGKSIFNRKKPLVENTLKRIYAGLVKFVANGDDTFIKKYYSGRPMGKVISVEGPAGTVTTVDGQALVKCNFLIKYNSVNGKTGKHNPPSIEDPSPVVSTQGRLGLASFNFLQSYYGNGNSHSTDEPCPTITTKDRFAKVNYLMMNYSSGQKVRPVDYPAGTVTGIDKHNLVSIDPWIMPTSFANRGRSIKEPSPTVLASRNHHYLINPQYSNKGNAIDAPAPVIIARQDKKPLGLITCELGEGFLIPVYDDDSETMIKIKIFMAHFGIADIKMRMLLVDELLRIQGFPENYVLIGTETEKKNI